MEKKSVFLEKFFFVEFAANADYDSAMLRVGLDCILDEVYIIVFVEYRDIFFESFVRLAEIFGIAEVFEQGNIRLALGRKMIERFQCIGFEPIIGIE